MGTFLFFFPPKQKDKIHLPNHQTPVCVHACVNQSHINSAADIKKGPELIISGLWTERMSW